MTKRQKKARRAKGAATWRERRNRDIMLLSLGKPQETKLKIGAENTHVRDVRYSLRKKGYIIERGSHTAYYDENTQRSERIEARRKGDPHYVYFDFKPISEKP